MATSIAPQLSLKVVAPAVEFYKKALNVEEILIIKNEDGSVHVAELSLQGAIFHLHEANANYAMPAPRTVELGVFTDDPDSLMDSALAAGGKLLSKIKDYEYGYRQGSFEDPFGYKWTLQKKLANAWEGVIGPKGEKLK
jgi:PhnB protein